MEPTQDRRILKTKRAIQQAFVEMLLETGFEPITVKAIAARANIGRKTFYLHFTDKYDLLDAIVNFQLEELAALCEEKKEKGLVEGTVLWFCYFDRQKPFFAALFATGNAASFRRRLLAFMEEQLRCRWLAGMDPQRAEVLQKFMATAVLGVLEPCVLGQLPISAGEAARQVGQLLEQLLPGPGA